MIFKNRKAGVLLHPTSLPGGQFNGEFGDDAYQFVDFISDCGFQLWQVLPLGQTHEDLSPYQSLSAHAGNTRLISINRLLKEAWASDVDYLIFLKKHVLNDEADKTQRLKFFLTQFDKKANASDKRAFQDFQCQHEFWLDDFSLFMVLHEKYESLSWVEWPATLRDRDEDALIDARRHHEADIRLVKFGQFIFFTQWLALKKYANGKNVALFGDIPLFVAYDSSEVWAYRKFFKLDEKGHCQFIAGVPPDYFSETGQRWGNPLYDWQAIECDNFTWWIQRLETQFELFDLLRIDHFRGLEAYWEIPVEEETAINGYWVNGPGEKFFTALAEKFDQELPLVAEDLGYITKEVHQLRSKAELPGMKILQFAFDSDSDNPYLPHNHEAQSVVYTGTHDNDTTLGWYQGLDSGVKEKLLSYYDYDGSEDGIPWLLIQSALASKAMLAMVPMQDLLALNSSHRMNVPGTADGNWRWRFRWEDVDKDKIRDKIREQMILSGRQ